MGVQLDWRPRSELDADPLRPVDGTGSGCCLSGPSRPHTLTLTLNLTLTLTLTLSQRYFHSLILSTMTRSCPVPDRDWDPGTQSQTQILPSWGSQSRGDTDAESQEPQGEVTAELMGEALVRPEGYPGRLLGGGRVRAETSRMMVLIKRRGGVRGLQANNTTM